MKKELLAVAMLLFAGGNLLAQPHVNDGTSYLMNQPLDMSTDFRDLSNTLFFADHLESFDAKSGEGLVNWKRGHLMPRQAFNTNGAQPRKMRMLDFPFTAYENDPNLKFKIDFVTTYPYANDPGGTQTCRFHHVGKGTGQGWKLESYRDE